MNTMLNRKSGANPSLRELLGRAEPVLAPGAYDALSARIIEQAGFPAVYMTGFGTAASLLGRPDVGLLGMAEMAGNAARMRRDAAAERTYYDKLVAAAPSERATQRPEYITHQNDITIALTAKRP